MEAIKPTIEQQMEQEGALMVKRVTGLTITTDDDYSRGGDILKDIKARIKAVKDYWKAPKAAAQAAHKTLVDREKQMLKPLEDAEATVKKTMLDYSSAREKAAREAAEAARREYDAEVGRLADLATYAELKGDYDTAEIMRDMAEAVPVAAVEVATPKTKYVSTRKVWKARVTDPKLVPAYFDGYELREINMTALNGLARQYEGGLNIPGVEFYMDETLSVRA